MFFFSLSKLKKTKLHVTIKHEILGVGVVLGLGVWKWEKHHI